METGDRLAEELRRSASRSSCVCPVIDAEGGAGVAGNSMTVKDSAAEIGRRASLAEADGKLAVSYQGTDNSDLKYAIRLGP